MFRHYKEPMTESTVESLSLGDKSQLHLQVLKEEKK